MVAITANIARPEEGAENLVATILFIRYHHKILFENMRFIIDYVHTC